jgi:hypothetical protein
LFVALNLPDFTSFENTEKFSQIFLRSSAYGERTKLKQKDKEVQENSGKFSSKLKPGDAPTW